MKRKLTNMGLNLICSAVVGVVVVGFITIVKLIGTTHPQSSTDLQISFPQEEEAESVTVSEWDRMIDALIKVESGGKSTAVNPKTGASGILQIMPIYVKDANRISGRNYTLEDRFDPDKSLEMFCIIQNHYNPDHDIEKAIRSHNPGAGDWYYDRVMTAMNDNNNHK